MQRVLGCVPSPSPSPHSLVSLTVCSADLCFAAHTLSLAKGKKKKTTQTEVHPMLKQLCLQPLRTDLGFYYTTYLNDHTN